MYSVTGCALLKCLVKGVNTEILPVLHMPKPCILVQGCSHLEEGRLFLICTKTPYELAAAYLSLPPPLLVSTWSSPQKEGGNVRTDGLGWDAWETRGLDWRELGLIEGREARRIGVPCPQVHLLGEGCPN